MTKTSPISNFLIIGTGIIDISIVREIKKKYPGSSITILEKEADVAYHSSGRNIEVLHAGFYYTADSDSLKAKFCNDGNKNGILNQISVDILQFSKQRAILYFLLKNVFKFTFNIKNMVYLLNMNNPIFLKC